MSFHGATTEVSERWLRGDQSSHLLQAISLADVPPDLSFDDRDLEIWRDVGWAPGPDGLLLHRDGDDLTAGKPYGYSVVGAVFVATVGGDHGMPVANVFLFLVTVALIGRILSWRLRGVALPLAIGAFALASTLYLNIHVTQPELFMAAVTGVMCVGILEGVRHDRLWLAATGVAAGAFLLTERLPAAALVVPLLAWVIWRQPDRWRRLALIAVAFATVLVAVLPYLETTGGESVTAYGGERYFLLPGSDTWPPDPALLGRANSNEYFSVDHVVGQLDPESWGDIGRAAMYTVVGRNTGMLVFTPMALVALVAALGAAPWRRPTSELGVVTFAVLAYLLFHVVLLTDTFWGGGHTLGNKYVAQVLPVFAVLLALSRMRGRVVVMASVVSIVVAIAALGPKLWHPEDALWAVWQTTRLQEALPFEYFAVSPDIYPPDGDG